VNNSLILAANLHISIYSIFNTMRACLYEERNASEHGNFADNIHTMLFLHVVSMLVFIISSCQFESLDHFV
jgi:hypothetical protein